MNKILKVIEDLLMFKKGRYNYHDLFDFYFEITGNGSISSFEKFLTFCYGQKVLKRFGSMQEKVFILNKTRMRVLVKKYKGFGNVKS